MDITTGPAAVWWQPQPTCPDHGDGPMRHDMATSRWTCAGWDGEGCGHTVTDEQFDQTWQPLGTAETLEFGFTPKDPP